MQQTAADLRDQVDHIIFSAGQMLACVRTAYNGGYLCRSHVSATAALRDDMGMMLARFEDYEYGTVSAHTIETMRRYEDMACDMIRTICEPKDGQEFCTRSEQKRA